MRRRRSTKVNSTQSSFAMPMAQCPAKTWTDARGHILRGRSVPNHCEIVGETARQLINLFPASLQPRLFPDGSYFAAACHDIGKVSPSFVAKIVRATGSDFKKIAELANSVPDSEYQWGGHAGVSQATAAELGAPKYVPEILGQHHGFSPFVQDKTGVSEVFGGSAWFDERKKLVDSLKLSLNSDWPVIENASQARVVAGLTSVADWIGSGKFFEDPREDWRPNVKTALTDAGFVRPVIRKELSFTQIFDPGHLKMKPHPAQSLFINEVTGPGIYILEAQMGMGKTEAALYAAYKLLEKGSASGIYFALPTQLTSNKIYDRFNAFLEQIVGAKTSNRAMLLHSGAWLLEHAEMGEEGRPGGAWFNHAKRGLLAPFAVGTIDQALMAVMNVKHGFVRAFGLAGKVVILDEVHSYDLYTGTILNELVTFLEQIGCTVIILSATLSKQRRESLVRQPVQATSYPLVTAQNDTIVVPKEVPVDQADSEPVTITHCGDQSLALEEALRRAENGQQVLWIENTVSEAQQCYLDLAARARSQGSEIGLLHSRFTPQDRQRNEALWVKAFGQDGWSNRAMTGRILVGTQVLEQSLDIDADVLISRFAPTDMLLQRIGRLWRHTDTPRSASAKKELWLLAPSLDDALASPHTAFGLTASVYAPYILCRSLDIWSKIQVLTLPSDIRHLIEQTYEERCETGDWSRLLHELKQGTRYRTGEEALQSLAQVTLSKGGKTLPEHKAETRYSDQDTHDVLLLRELTYDAEKKSTQVVLMDNRVLMIPKGRHSLDKAGWRRLASAFHQQLVRIKPSDCPPKIRRQELEKHNFSRIFYLGDPELDEALLRVALVNVTGEIQSLDRRSPEGNKMLEYRNDLGYRVNNKKEQ